MKRFILFIRPDDGKPYPGMDTLFLGSYERAEEVLDNMVNLGSGKYGHKFDWIQGKAVDVLDAYTHEFRSVYMNFETHTSLEETRRRLTTITQDARRKTQFSKT